MQLLIKYGTLTTNIDVTQKVKQLCCFQDLICIPATDYTRAQLFGDPVPGILKVIFVEIDNRVFVYDNEQIAWIDLTKKPIVPITKTILSLIDGQNRLRTMHDHLQLRYGSFLEEYPEQLLAVRFLTGSEKVLELGGNIGRNSLVIASTLVDDKNLVTLECNDAIARQLGENRDANSMHFHLESSALSKCKLIQTGWTTIPSETILDGYSPVKSITYDQLKSTYPIDFDTLVVDCEGAFYYILRDMPEVLNGIKLVIMENDYPTGEHKQYVDQALLGRGLQCVCSQGGGWGCCTNNFYEVWMKMC
jgi:hypothetical protein